MRATPGWQGHDKAPGEAVLFMEPDEPDLLLVQLRDHVPRATQLLGPIVRWAATGRNPRAGGKLVWEMLTD